MAWIESHQELRNHPKLSAARQTLAAQIKEHPSAQAQLIGHLHMLWWWAMDYAMDGDLSGFSEVQIADAAGWSGDPKKFIESLYDAGFLDGRSGGVGGASFNIHDWFDFCGEIILKRLRRKEEKRQKTAAVRRTMAAKSPPTVPDRTVPDRTKPTETPPAALPRDAFELIWARYPRKIGKESAASKFKAQVRRFTDWLDIQRALDGYKAYIDREKIEQKFIQHGSTWFNKHWRDWIAYVEEKHGPNDGPRTVDYAALARAKREAEKIRNDAPSGAVPAGV